MDRIIARNDHEGRPVIFAADSLSRKQKNILAWRPDAEPFTVSLDFYHASTPLEEQDTKRIVKEYSKTWGQNEVQVMQRLPRVIGERPKFHVNPSKKEKTELKVVKQEKKQDDKAPPHQAFVMRKHGDFWRVQDVNTGETKAYVTDENSALAVLKDLLGDQKSYMQ